MEKYKAETYEEKYVSGDSSFLFNSFAPILKTNTLLYIYSIQTLECFP